MLQSNQQATTSEISNADILAKSIPGYASFEAMSKFYKDVLSYHQKINSESTEYTTYLGQSSEYLSMMSEYYNKMAKDITGSIDPSQDAVKVATDLNKEFNNAYGRLGLLSEKQVVDILEYSRIMGTTTKNIFDEFSKIGKTIDEVGGLTGDLAAEAIRFGVPLSKVANDVIPKLGLINKLGFTNGIKGLTEMVIQSNILGLSFEKIQAYGEKMFDIGEAQDAANFFTRMGSQIEEFKDPFYWMGSAYDGFEKITPKVSELFSTFLKFDAETGKFTLPKGAIKDIEEYSKQFGISFDEAVKTGGQFLQMQQRLNVVKSTFKNINDEEAQRLANSISTSVDAAGKLKYEFAYASENGELMKYQLDGTNSSLEEQELILKKIKQELSLSPEQLAKDLRQTSISQASETKRIEKGVEVNLPYEFEKAGVSGEVFKQMMTTYKSSADAYLSTFNSSNAQFQGFLNSFSSNVGSLVQNLASGNLSKAFGDLTSLVGSFTNVAGSGIMDTFNATLKNIVNTQLPGLSNAVGGLEGVINGVKDALKTIEEWGKKFGATSSITPTEVPTNQQNNSMVQSLDNLSASIMSTKNVEMKPVVIDNTIPQQNLNVTEENINKNVNGKIVIEVTSNGNFDKLTTEELRKKMLEPSFLESLKTSLEKVG